MPGERYCRLAPPAWRYYQPVVVVPSAVVRPAPLSLRIKPELVERLRAVARENGRSLNAEIISRLQRSLEGEALAREVITRAVRSTARLSTEIADFVVDER